MKRVKKNFEILKILSCCNKRMRTSIINSSTHDLIDTICECVLNLLNGNINLSDSEKTHLSKYKNVLRKLLERKKIKEKKKILIQKGGFLQFLLPSVITGLTTLIENTLSKE